MTGIVNGFEYVMNINEDPRVKHWTLMDSPLPTLCIIALYLLLVLLILPAYMKNRKPFYLTKIIQCYNIFQIGSCSLLVYSLISAGWWQGKYSWGCQVVDYSNNSDALEILATFYWLYILKIIELVETVFFALRKKFNQVSGLHVYHHASTLFLAYLACKYVGGGMASVPFMVNSSIHVLMYTYYYLSSLGPEWQKRLNPWKRRLTMAQMVQFTILIIHGLTALQPSCKAPKQFLFLYVPNVILIFKMFYDFYQKSYIVKRPTKIAQSTNKEKSN